jgi:pilus assembly protein CpaC
MPLPPSARRCLSGLLLSAAALLALETISPRARADDGGSLHELRIAAESDSPRQVNLGIGRSMIVDLPTDASEIFVSNPQVANAVVRSARRVYLIALASGETTVFALDKNGGKIAVLDVTVGRDMDELREILAKALPGNDIHVSAINDTVILTGTVGSALEAEMASKIANAFVGYTAVGGSATGGGSGSTTISLGSTTVVNGELVNSLVIRDEDQVMVRLTVAEVDRDIIKQLGISPNGGWSNSSFTTNNMPAGSTQPASFLDTVTNSAGQARNVLGGYGGLALANKTGSLNAYIQAFEKDGVAHILAEPTVTAISGESATFTAGGTIPITSQSSINPQTGVCTITSTLTPYGVTLNITPTVLSAGRISLHLATEVTEVDPLTTIPSACTNNVGFTTRKNETTVELPSGGSIMSAGLIQQQSSQVIAGLPGLMNLPILGALFRSRDYQRQESELVVIVTPYIAKPLSPDQISRPDDGLVDATDPQSMFLGRVNQIYSSQPNPQAIQNFKGQVGFIQD